MPRWNAVISVLITGAKSTQEQYLSVLYQKEMNCGYKFEIFSGHNEWIKKFSSPKMRNRQFVFAQKIQYQLAAERIEVDQNSLTFPTWCPLRDVHRTLDGLFDKLYEYFNMAQNHLRLAPSLS